MSYLLFINIPKVKFWQICLTSGDKFVPKLQPSKPNHTHRISNVLSVRSKHCTESLVFVWSSLLVPVFEHYKEISPYGKSVPIWQDCLPGCERARKSHTLSRTDLLITRSHTNFALNICQAITHTPFDPWHPSLPFCEDSHVSSSAVSLPPLFWPNEDQQLPHGAERWIS